MRLARKLMFALVTAVLLVFAVRAAIRVRDEIRRSESDMTDEQRLVGRVLRPAVVQVWRNEGKDRALAMLTYATSNLRRMQVRWVLDSQSVPPEAWLRGPRLTPSAPQIGEERAFVRRRTDGDYLTTYVLLSDDGSVPGALQISESMDRPRRALREKLLEVLTTAAIAAAVSMVVVSAVGVMVVGRPMRRLAEKARRIGAGDLSAPLEIRQRDEIGELAREMNQMCERLRGAQERIALETGARIRTLEQLRHADRLTTVGMLASGIAHELGTPLNVVRGRAKMIMTAEVEGPQARDSAQTVFEQAERMTKIIRQLLDFARRRGLQKGPCDLVEVGRQSLTLLRPMAAKSNVKLEIDENVSPPGAVPADPAQLQQALMNLVVNAIQAMPNGGTATLGIGKEMGRPPPDHGGAVTMYAFLRVRDQGVGVPAEALARVFEPFYTSKGVGEGTGLGLSVAYGIVQEHGGWIDVDSRVGVGSTFTIFLPLQSSEDAAA